MSNRFEEWWSKYESKTRDERIRHFGSLPASEQIRLKQSFLEDGWCHLFCQNYIDEALDHIKEVYGLDLIDMRIKALKFRRVFLIDKETWEHIESIIFEYDPLYNSDIIFGGLTTQPWGKKKNFYLISAKREVNG